MAGLRLYQEQLPILYPHTFAGMQKWVMAMADVSNDIGKKTWFGKDKGAIAYQKFLSSLKQTIIGLTLDGKIRESASADEVVSALEEVLSKFALAFPNWPEAYRFANSFFSQNNKSDYMAVINRLRSC
jgi:hypothetical protein